ncbi:low molecular weight phosphatase family protein [Halomicroarcula sp. GCM10025817]|uniref:low molecular weight phosphatase family protein n=1 Tax=Haloarcula TaxID=2237 RepID=UPI0023E7C91D|nr:low molecular weight phosphatase family protein [Halomicroarcula sp. SYNS111]
MTDTFRVAFDCVQNAGRAQTSTAFAERAVAECGLEDFVPRTVTDAGLNACDLVATRGCSTPELGADVESRGWALADRDGQDAGVVREIREQIRERVADVFDDVEARLEPAA